MSFELILIIYLTRYAFVAVSFGTFFACKKIFKSFNIWVNFISGACLSPFVTISLNYLLGFFAPGYPPFIMWLLSPIVSLLVFVLTKNKTNVFCELKNKLLVGIRNCFSKKELNGTVKMHKVVIIAVLLVFLVFAFVLSAAAYYHAIATPYASDYSHYLTQAQYFANVPNSFEVDNYTGEKYGTIPPDDHGAFWPVYLADGWSFAPNGVYNYNTYIFPNVAVTVLYFVFLLMLYAAAFALTNNAILSLLAPIFLFAYRYSSLGLFGSREQFRFIPLLATFLFCLDLIMRVQKEATPNKKVKFICATDYVILCLLIIFSMQGHGSNLFMLVGFAFVLLYYFIYYKVSISIIVKMLICSGASLVISLIENIQLFINTGSFRNYTSHITEGTEYAIDLKPNYSASTNSLYELFLSFHPVSIIFLVSGLSILFVLLVAGIKNNNKLKSHNKMTMPVALLSLSVFLPLTGIYNLSGSDVFTWFLSQIRYRMVFFVFLAVAIIYALQLLQFKLAYKLYNIIVICVLFICGLIINFNTDFSLWGTPQRVERNRVIADEIITANVFAQQHVENGYVVSGHRILSFYFENAPKYYLTEYCKPLIQSKSDLEIEAAIDDLNIDVFVFDMDLQYGNLELLPFYNYLLCEDNATLYRFDGVNTIDVFVMK